MSVHHFGWLPDGTEILRVRIGHGDRARCDVITYGSAVQDLIVPLGDGSQRRVVLGFPTLDGYLADKNYIGVTVGRTASRITRGRIQVDGREYRLSINDRDRAHLHGGATGFSARPWRLLAVEDRSVLLGLTSLDGDQGYPGQVEVQCLYELEGDATLRIVMTATTDAPTVLNLAHHSYFNLLPGSSIRQHFLEVRARRFLELDDDMLATGNEHRVADTSADFETLRQIGETGNAFDMAFVLDEFGESAASAAILWSPDRALRMTLNTTEPCLVFYDGGHMVSGLSGHDGSPYDRHDGLCLEPMRFLDSPNHPSFPSWELLPGETYRQVTTLCFDAMPSEPSGRVSERQSAKF